VALPGNSLFRQSVLTQLAKYVMILASVDINKLFSARSIGIYPERNMPDYFKRGKLQM
jgi:hypothetical protein